MTRSQRSHTEQNASLAIDRRLGRGLDTSKLEYTDQTYAHLLSDVISRLPQNQDLKMLPVTAGQFFLDK